MRVAAVQTTATADKAHNLAVAGEFVRRATADGATLVALPELFNVYGSAEVLADGAEELDGPTSEWARELAADGGIWLVAGSFTEKAEGSGRHYNTCCLYDPSGRRVAAYRKVHLFDIGVPGAAFCESRTTLAGDELVVADVEGVGVGLAVCYDIRFPELYRLLALRGARVVVQPTAFMLMTGRDHFEVLARARAIENGIFMVAPDQVGALTPAVRVLGRSLVVDPWGTVLATAPDRQGYVLADLDFDAQDRLRAELPSLANRRPDVYGWPLESPADDAGGGSPAR